jgi:vancomycin permeability regulator SanA
VSGRWTALGAVAATLTTAVALNASLSYVTWGLVLGMNDVEWLPLFPIWIVLGVAAAIAARALYRRQRAAVAVTSIVSLSLSVPFLWLMLMTGVLACGAGPCGGVAGAVLGISHSR